MQIDPNNPPKHDTVLDVTAEQIARTYAEAFLGAVNNDHGAVEELQAIEQEVLIPHPGILEPLRSAFLSHDDRVEILDRVFGGKLSDNVLNFLKVLSKHNRLGIIRTVIAQVSRLYEEFRGNVRVRVNSAAPLDGGLMGDIENMLRAKTGREPVITFAVNPDLIAGLEIHVGDTVYDSSLRTSLAKAKQSILNHTIEQIERNPQNFLSSH